MNMSDSFNHLGSIWYQFEPIEVHYCPNQFLGLDFFAVSYSKPALALFWFLLPPVARDFLALRVNKNYLCNNFAIQMVRQTG
jgi:hypothetical protein